MKNRFTDEQLTSYALGELNSEDAQQIEIWLESHPEAKATLYEIQEAVSLLQDSPMSIEGSVYQLSDSRKNKLEAYWGQSEQAVPQKGFSFKMPVWSWATAMSLVMGLSVYLLTGESQNPLFPTSEDGSLSAEIEAQNPLLGSSQVAKKDHEDSRLSHSESISHFIIDKLENAPQLKVANQESQFRERLAFESQKGVSLTGTGGKMSFPVQKRRPYLKGDEAFSKESTVDGPDGVQIKNSQLKIDVLEGPSNIQKGVKQQYHRFLTMGGRRLTNCLQKYIPFKNVSIGWKLNHSNVEGPIQVSQLKPHPKLELCLLKALRQIPRPELAQSVWNVNYQLAF